LPRLRPVHLLLLLPLVVYLALPTRAYYWDGLAFAIAIEHDYPLRGLLHPNHLLYMPLGRMLWVAAQAIGLSTRVLFLLQRVNGVLGFASILLVYRLLRMKGIECGTAVAGALVMAFSATWWKYATDCDAYIAAIFCLLLGWLFLASGRWISGAFALAAAMLFHELSVLVLPAALLAAPGKRRFPLAVLALAPVGAVYLWAYRVVHGDWAMGGIPGWLVSHSPDSGFSFAPFRDAGRSLLGTLRLFFAGKPSGVVRDVLTATVLLVALVTVIALAMLLRRAGRPQFGTLSRPLLLWAAVYVCFLFVWMPQNTFYRLFYLPPLILLAAEVSWSVRGREIAGAAVVLLFSANFALLIYPGSRVENNPPLACAMRFEPQWPGGTPIVFERFHPDLWTISYFNPQAAWIGWGSGDLAELDRYLAYARSHGLRLWLEATAYEKLRETECGRAWLVRHPQLSPGLGCGAGGRNFQFFPIRAQP
jgi:hypothetical protein